MLNMVVTMPSCHLDMMAILQFGSIQARTISKLSTSELESESTTARQRTTIVGSISR